MKDANFRFSPKTLSLETVSVRSTEEFGRVTKETLAESAEDEAKFCLISFSL